MKIFFIILVFTKLWLYVFTKLWLYIHVYILRVICSACVHGAGCECIAATENSSSCIHHDWLTATKLKRSLRGWRSSRPGARCDSVCHGRLVASVSRLHSLPSRPLLSFATLNLCLEQTTTPPHVCTVTAAVVSRLVHMHYIKLLTYLFIFQPFFRPDFPYCR